MALQEAAVFVGGINHIRLYEEEETGHFLATRQGSFFMPTKDTRDPLRFLTTNHTTLCMVDEETDYMMTREGSLSFPTPKLGAKTRPC